MPGFDGSHATNSRLSDSYRPIMLLYHHSYITSDFHLLTFGAAAALQLRHPRLKGEDTSGDEAGVLRYDSRLIVSPYNLPDNLFDLTRYEPAVQDFAKALTFFTPVRHDYATADYLDSFNFSAVFDILRKITKLRGTSWQRRQFYVVTFRSQLKPVVDSEHLFKLDCNSHQEAIATGGLLKYWYGRKNDEYQNLATCFWESRDHAYNGGKGPWHAQARAAARVWYQSIIFRTFKLTIEDDIAGWTFEECTEDKLGFSTAAVENGVKSR